MTTKERILLESKAWLVEKFSMDSNYLNSLQKSTKPNILWIGSSDNLISIREVANTEPGELIVHRNIAAQIRTDDINLMATLEDAIDAGIEYIIVCGSSNCKGIREVVQGLDEQIYMRKWLDDLIELYNEHSGELEHLSQVEQEKRLCELSIKEQLMKLSEMDLSTGTIKELFSMTARESLKQVASVV